MERIGVRASQKWGSAGLNELEISEHQEWDKSTLPGVVRMHLLTVLHALSCEQSARK